MATRTQWFAFEFTSNDGLYISSGRRGQPESSPAAVRIDHGLAEHIGCDADWVPALIEAGIVVYDDDHRGPSSRWPRFWPITAGFAMYVLSCLSIALSGNDDPVGQQLEELRVLIQRYVEALCRVSPTISIGNRNEVRNETEEGMRANTLAWIACLLQPSRLPYPHDSGARGSMVTS